MTIQNIHKNPIRHRNNNEWLQRSGQSEKPENDTKIKILKISRNYHKPNLPQGLEHLFKVTSCNEKCNFFILLQCITLFRILLMGKFLFVETEPSYWFNYAIFSSVAGE